MIGSKLTNFLSHWMRVTTLRDGLCEKILFKEGVFESRDVTEVPNNLHGTIVTWQPSEEFFTHTEVEIDKVKDLFKTIVCLCPGLTIDLLYKGEKSIYHSDNGLSDLADEATKGKEILKNRLVINESDGKNKLDLIMTYTSNYSSSIVPYVNVGLTDSGQHITQIKTILTRELNKFFREKKWLKEKDENLTGEDAQEGLYIIFNMTTSGVSYDAQIKARITKIDARYHTQVFAEKLQEWLKNNEKEIKEIADKAMNARKAREAAKKARESVRNDQKKKKEKALKFDSKLADCFNKDRSKCELIITEGDSASGNLKAAKDNNFQAVLPVRGKILNLWKASIEKIQKNAEIMTFFDAIGLEIDIKTMKVQYDAHKLRYGKIIMMSDADVSKSAYERLFA